MQTASSASRTASEVTVGLRVRHNRADAQLLAGTHNTDGNLAAVGNQYFIKHRELGEGVKG